MENAHIKESGEVLSYFGVTEETGLSPDQVTKNLSKYGYNGEEKKKKGDGRWMDGCKNGVGWSFGEWKEGDVMNEVVEKRRRAVQDSTLGFREGGRHRGRSTMCLRGLLGENLRNRQKVEEEKWRDD